MSQVGKLHVGADMLDLAVVVEVEILTRAGRRMLKKALNDGRKQY